MKVVEPEYEILPQGTGIEGVYKQIELCGRTCYASSVKIADGSAEPFVERMVKSQHCYTGDTEVLTDIGWIRFRDYKGEKVAVVNPNTCEFVGFEYPKGHISKKYKGLFYKYPAMGIEVTDGHRMFGHFRTSKDNFYKTQSYEVFECNTPFVDNNGNKKTLGERMFKVPRHCPRPATTEPFAEILGFWLGDGCKDTSLPNRLVFHLKKRRKIEYLRALCKRAHCDFLIGANNIYKVFAKGAGKSFACAFYNKDGKFIPNMMFINKEIAHSMIVGLINSDGAIRPDTKSITFTSTSKSIIDWLCAIAPIAGYTVSYRGINSMATEKQKASYKILLLDTDFTINNDARVASSKVVITDKEEQVYCVSVSTGLIIVRGTNGIVSICGNCAMLEHGTIYLKVEYHSDFATNADLVERYQGNKFSKVNIADDYAYITTNYRVIVENGWYDDLDFMCDCLPYHEKRVTVRLTTQIAVSREANRHRVNSIAEQSTRYCNYTKDKFGGEVAINKPLWVDTDKSNFDGGSFASLVQRMDSYKEWDAVAKWWFANKVCEMMYLSLVEDSGLKPQDARAILPLDTNTELIHTAFVSDWKHFFELRSLGTTGKPHPDMEALAMPLMNEFKERGLI